MELGWDVVIDVSWIGVEVKDGIVILLGYVESYV